jgi:hypothetical protein
MASIIGVEEQAKQVTNAIQVQPYLAKSLILKMEATSSSKTSTFDAVHSHISQKIELTVVYLRFAHFNI